MFVSLNNLLPGFARRHKIKNRIDKITTAELSEKIIKNIVGAEVKVIWREDYCVLLKTKTSAAANEIKLKEVRIKKELQENNILVSSVKCVI